MKTKWNIVAVKSDGPVGYRWRWTKSNSGKITEVSKERFEYYYDCVVDAGKHGCCAARIKGRTQADSLTERQ